jgi:hypothetical protein
LEVEENAQKALKENMDNFDEKDFPKWFKYAPLSAQAYLWELYIAEKLSRDNGLAKYRRENISYNKDWTINIIKLGKTFCNDITGDSRALTYSEAEKLAKEKRSTHCLLWDEGSELIFFRNLHELKMMKKIHIGEKEQNKIYQIQHIVLFFLAVVMVMVIILVKLFLLMRI